PAEDDHLIHSTRMAIRDQLRAPGITLDGLSDADLKPLLEIMLAVPGEATAELRFALFEKVDVSADVLAKQLPSMTKNLPAARLNALVVLARKKLGADIHAQAAVLQGVLDALAQRNIEPGENLRAWGGDVARKLLEKDDGATGWSATALDGGPVTKSPWAFQERQCADGKVAQVISSLPNGETLTGIARSPAFPLAGKVSFYLCGHDGEPGQPAGKKNFVRLRDSANGSVLREAAPPRNDTAQRIEWNLAEFSGRTGFIEVTDGDTGPAYAWLAVGRFDPPAPAPTDPASATRATSIAADLARSLKITALTPQLSAFFSERKNDAGARAAAARALIAFGSHIDAVGATLASTEEPDSFREKLATHLGAVTSPSMCKRVADAMTTAPFKLQQSFATALSANRCGTMVLLDAIERGQASINVLRDKATFERLLASGEDAEDARLRELQKKLPPASAEADKLIAARRTAFDPAKASATRGADVFTRNCAACHALEGKGGIIGPQLAGIGGRGADRLCEDILDPNRNVDRAFRLTLVTKKDGSVLSGLLRSDEGAQIVLADLAGQEIRVAKSEVASQKETDASLMPATFGDLIPPAEFSDLLAYLLAHRVAK
ncbi:MAG: c-type cytochrome, partial [Chthoniobacteraceae bacterium]